MYYVYIEQKSAPDSRLHTGIQNSAFVVQLLLVVLRMIGAGAGRTSGISGQASQCGIVDAALQKTGLAVNSALCDEWSRHNQRTRYLPLPFVAPQASWTTNDSDA